MVYELVRPWIPRRDWSSWNPDRRYDLKTFPSPSRSGHVSLLTGGGGGLMISNNFSRKWSKILFTWGAVVSFVVHSPIISEYSSRSLPSSSSIDSGESFSCPKIPLMNNSRLSLIIFIGIFEPVFLFNSALNGSNRFFMVNLTFWTPYDLDLTLSPS